MQATMPLNADLGNTHGTTTTPPGGEPLGPRRSGRARTSRVRDDFIDSAFLQYVTPDNQAHAFADEEEVHPPSSQQSKRQPASEGTSKAQLPVNNNIAYTAPDDRPVGPQHQATNIPAFRPLPAQPSASEARFLHLAPLYATADHQPADAGNVAAAARAAASAVFKASYQAAPPGAARVALLDAAVKALDAQMGPDMVKVLRLDTLGSKLRASWQPHEELLFCLGMCDKYRFFKYIRQLYLRSRSANDLNGYYHNVWKTRSTPEADEFLSLREQGAGNAELYTFVGKTTDKLTAMWDRATMGELPKLLKDAAGAAEADAELQAAAMDIACSEGAAPSPSASWARAAASSDSDTPSVKAPAAAASAATPVPRPRQRKRPASGAVSSRRRAQRQPQAPPQQQQQQQQQAAQGKTSPQVPTAPGQQQQPPAQGALAAPVLLQWIQPVSLVSASAVAAAVAAVQQQQLLLQQQQQQAPAQGQALKQDDVQQQQPKRQRSEQLSFSSGAADAAGTGTVPSAPGLDTFDVLQYPQMPTYHEPDMDSPAALDDWLEQLPAYRASVTEYMTSVNSMTDAAVLDYQRRIQQVQEHRGRLQAEADAYIRSLVTQGQQVLRIVETRTASASEQQPAQPAQQPAAAPAVQQQQQGGIADLQAAVQQLLSSHTKHTKYAATELAAAVKAAGTLPSPVSPANKAGGVAAACPTTPVVDAQRPRQDTPGARGTAAAAGSPAGGVGSSSEDCDMYLACTEAV